GLADDFDVQVICGQPTYSSRGTCAPRRERRNGVQIHRCWGTTLDKDKLAYRILNSFTISLSVFGFGAWNIEARDRVLVVTNPPFLPFMMAIVCWLRGAKCFLCVHDVYPEVLTAIGFTRPNGILTRIIAWLNRLLYRRMERVIVLG